MTWDEVRWHEEFTRLGPEAVGFRYANRMAILDNAPEAPPSALVEAWLTQSRKAAERRERRRFWVTSLVGIIAAVAACIAAWPIVKEWEWVKELLGLLAAALR